MQENELNCRVKPKKPKRPSNLFYRIANLLQRNFSVNRPLKVLVIDITYLPFGNTTLYLSSIMDMYNREIIACSIDGHQNQSLINDTLNQVGIPGSYILRNDQGSVYT